MTPLDLRAVEARLKAWQLEMARPPGVITLRQVTEQAAAVLAQATDPNSE